MEWIKRHGFYIWLLFLSMGILAGCSVSYSFNGGAINYDEVRSITIRDFNNQAPLVYAPFANNFSEALRDRYTQRTKLSLVSQGGDLLLEGNITGYSLEPVAVQENAFAARTKFTVTISVNYVNNVNEKESFEKSFSAYREFDSSQMFNDVQDQLLEEITQDLIKEIFNATVENW
ncbi:LptE family protein [Porphyromonas macacae]|uniref:LptE family protein n=1 Tax=Porphyromonas macacae TaxID=28115 RepID=UPI0024AD5B63|nr:LptE family protein [Porphyromonas macacae]